MKTILRTISAAAALAVAALAGTAGMVPATAAEQVAPPRYTWSFAGPFGMFDRGQLQRGLKVYRQVCQTCHGLSYVAFRNLAEPGGPGFTSAQAAAIAAEYKIQDGPNDEGEMFERDGRLADRFPAPFANDAQARAIHNGMVPPDLSLMAKARTYERGFPWFVFDIFTLYQEQGVDYLTALLLGYEDPPADFNLPPGTAYNRYFPGHAFGMANPLSDGVVEYTDGTPSTVQNYARDVSAFLMWTAEPHMEARKRIGFQVMIFLIVFSGMLYFVKKRVWAPVHGHT